MGLLSPSLDEFHFSSYSRICLLGGKGGKHKHMRLEHLLRSWSNPVAQMFAEASPVQVVHHLHLGNAQIASDGCTDLWGWLYAPRVSCGPCCMHPVCLVRVAVCTPCALWGAGCMHPVCLMGVAVWIPCVTVQRMLRRNGMWRGEACSGMPYPLHLERMAARIGSW